MKPTKPTMRRYLTAGALGVVVVLGACPAQLYGTELFEDFGPTFHPTSNLPTLDQYWYLVTAANPAQDGWSNVVPGDGYAHLTVTPDAAPGDYQTLGLGTVGPGHRMEMRAKGALVEGYTGFLFTYGGIGGEIDIELVPADREAAPHAPEAWSDARFSTYLGDDMDTRHAAIANGTGGRTSHFEDDAFHVYTIEWLTNRVTFIIDGVRQHVIVPPILPQRPAELLAGLRRVEWAGTPKWNGTRTMLVDWLHIHPIDANSPVARADTYRLEPGESLALAAPGVMANDQGHDLTAVLVVPPEHGTLSLAPDGGFTYVPADGFAGVDAFDYRVIQGATDNESNTARVTLQVPGRQSPGPIRTLETLGR